MNSKQAKSGNPAGHLSQSAAHPAAEYNPYLDPECLLNTNEYAALRGSSPSTIRRERSERRGVPFIIVNHNVVRYRRKDILDYINSLKRIEVYNPDFEARLGAGPKVAQREGTNKASAVQDDAGEQS